MAARNSGGKYLPKLASGEFVGCFGLTEPDHGSDPGGMKTRAVKDAGRLPPQRRQDVDHQFADRRCRGGVGEDCDGVIRGFVVERGMKGFSTPKIEGKFSLRASVTGEIVLEDCFVPEANLLPNVRGLVRAVRLPQPRALRHLVGRDGRRGILLARRAQLHDGPQAVRPPARRQPAHPEEARRHADRDHAGSCWVRCVSAA